ncbi:DUF1697 domain-containing protein [Salinispira pacifica]|uniref:DUF1697 domain-containing protein n=1 Tax=Salinispira pacifica TaxID=1307761 RepID=V5WKK8_9SPIO|nr:DUF1697 domain-containing protein [Salinispira pacifica]AHC16362.1 hypothetical protein L21SP2_3018 [Salinispira pacifica]
MQWVALLRGINVGGRNKVPMKELRHSLEKEGFSRVKSYIASGNIILNSSSHTGRELTGTIETILQRDFSVDTRVLILRGSKFQQIAEAIPGDWENDKEQKSDVLFLFPEDDSRDILSRVPPREGIDTAHYVPGALLWNVLRRNQGKTGLQKITSTDIYKSLTIRNVNTVRKISSMLNQDS